MLIFENPQSEASSIRGVSAVNESSSETCPLRVRMLLDETHDSWIIHLLKRFSTGVFGLTQLAQAVKMPGQRAR